MTNDSSILVVGESSDGRLSATTKELLNAGARLAGSLGRPLQAVLLGTNLTTASQEAVAYGAGKVLLAEHALLDEGHLDAHVAALQEV